ncbi:MAG: response regulator [Candidatus Nealsonbacteria bacterium]|nr:response regulator [Candidatus Nealsonbacteria bacterium]
MQKILFIEDESALQRTLGKKLELAGYTIIEAMDGEKGIELAKSEKPDLILLDLILPKKNGFDVLKEIRSFEKTKNIPVIILTNLDGTKEVEKALEFGATTYLVKINYSLEDVIEKIGKILSKNEN